MGDGSHRVPTLGLIESDNVTYRALIVDDERLARAGLRKLLEAREDLEVVAEASNVDLAIESLEKHKPDVMFLDIQMPDASGFELFDRVEVRAHVVFVTAYSEHALRAFEVNALDYLVKPVDPRDIERALSRLGTEPLSPRDDSKLLTLDDVVVLHEGQRIRFARVAEIVFIASADDYSEVHLASGTTVLVGVTVKRWEERLPSVRFARIHRSFLVNVAFINDVIQESGQWRVNLRTKNREKTLPMSRRFAQSLKRHFKLPDN